MEEALRAEIPGVPPIEEPEDDDDDGGCFCSANGTSGSGFFGVLALVGLIAFTRRRIFGGR